MCVREVEKTADGSEPGVRLLRSLEDSVEGCRVLGIQGRDMLDLVACVRCLTTGLLPDVSPPVPHASGSSRVTVLIRLRLDASEERTNWAG